MGAALSFHAAWCCTSISRSWWCRQAVCAFDVASRIQFVGNREQVFALKQIEAMLKNYHKAKRAAEDRVTKIDGEHESAIRKLLKQKESA